MKMILEDTNLINALLNELADKDIVEPMVEPIDDSSLEVNFWDWADIVGVVDDFAPEILIDENGKVWYTY
jgi:hypothetical protein